MSERLTRWVAGAAIVGLLGFAAVSLLRTAPAPEGRVLALAQRLRCPTCQSVSVAESPSETAASMRRIVESQVEAGRSDEEIIAYFVDRYGPWVLLDPPREGRTLLLWLLPAVAALIGGAVLLTRSGARAPAGLTTAERAEVLAAKQHYCAAQDSDEP